MSELPLSGVRVLDLSRVLAGPFCAMVLGDLGADVIKVERPGSGDDTRGWGPPFLAGGESAYFFSVNRNKRSVAIDLKSPRGQELLADLIRDADVVIDNFRQGTLEGWGFDAQWFHTQAPDVVRGTISGYGGTGPKAGAPGYDFILQAETGLMAITGEAEGQPMKLGVAIVDLCTGLLATIGVLAALNGRDRGNASNRRVEVNLHDTGVQMLVNVASNVLASGQDAARYGNGHPNIVPYRTYPTSDGWVAVAVGNDAQFRIFAAALDHPEWADDPRFVRNRDRIDHRTEIDALIGSVTRTRPQAHWRDVLAASGLPAGSINGVRATLDGEQTRRRGLIDQIEHVSAGLIEILRLPMDLDGEGVGVRLPPPTLGQHTKVVLQDDLGVAPEDVQALETENVVGLS